MKYKERSRRNFIGQCLQAGCLTFGVSLFLGACGSKKAAKGEKDVITRDCGDLSAVSEGEKEKRHKLGYVESSPIDESFCGNCSLYIPGESEGACGKCMLFDGPVYAEGYCTYWAPLV